MGRPKGSKTSKEKKAAQTLSKMLKLYLKAVPINVIAECVNIPASTVRLRLKPFRKVLENRENIDTYGDFRSLMFNAAELKLLQSLMCDEKHIKGNLNEVAYAFSQVLNARRLEESKSTTNHLHAIKNVDTSIYK